MKCSHKYLPQWIIEKKRDGKTLTADEIKSFIENYNSRRIPDYQMSALAMAIYFQGMNFDETVALTKALMDSGEMLDLSAITLPKIDKHSTGGVGDKISLVLAPAVAACGIAVPMIAGRGLGITGGTIDKLESIPCYKTNLTSREFLRIVQRCGCSIIAQTSQLAPADGKLYALRDVTGTVPSIPLIAASIMSKKLAEGIDGLVLDVKCGSGAFMRDKSSAKKLASIMVEIGRKLGKPVVALITDMNEPLGRNVGNAVEIMEVVQLLQGSGDADVVKLVAVLGAYMLILGGKASTLAEGKRMILKTLQDGRSFSKFKEMVTLHGGNPNALQDFQLLPRARYIVACPARKSGYVVRMDAELIGRASILLGAGRSKVGDKIDYSAGITNIVKTGEQIKKGEPLFYLHSNMKDKLKLAKQIAESAVIISSTPPTKKELILEVYK